MAAKGGLEEKFIAEAIQSGQLAGDGAFTKKCAHWFRDYSGSEGALLTPSCTHALEMTAVLLDIQPGDEVIMPSYTFVSTANAFVLRGAKIVFVDIKPGDMNLDESKIEAAISDRTKVIVPVHYAGIPCEMDAIMEIAHRHNLYVVEDAAQALKCSYRGKALGAIGHFGAISFHTTKNFTSGGEGGLLLVNDAQFNHRAEVYREKGTNRAAFFRGEVDKYTWRDIGSSMLPSEIQMAYLWGQLNAIEEIHAARMGIWERYYEAFKGEAFVTSQPPAASDSTHNGHIFYVIGRKSNREYLPKFKEAGIHATSHYEPLHASDMGKKHGRVSGEMTHTEHLASHIIRLPIYQSLPASDVDYVIEQTKRILSE